MQSFFHRGGSFNSKWCISSTHCTIVLMTWRPGLNAELLIMTKRGGNAIPD